MLLRDFEALQVAQDTTFDLQAAVFDLQAGVSDDILETEFKIGII